MNIHLPSVRTLVGSLLILLSAPVSAEVELSERRKDQFPDDSGYYIIPSPYSIPGIGSGFLLAGALPNIQGSNADLYGFGATGDLQGYGLFATEIHLLKDTLILDLTAISFNKATSQVYRARGMSTDGDDYILAELDKNEFMGARATYTMFERRFEIYGLAYRNKAKLAAIRNRDGSIIQSAIDSETNEVSNATYGFRLDLTDDYVDPRRGIRLESSLWHSPTETANNPDYDIIELNLTGYLPVGDRDTLAINYFRADADVNRQGETDPAAVQVELGINCASGTPSEQSDCQSLVNDTIANNTYGSVGSLGGLSRLRSYPEDRFKGSHARFFGIEYRWNLVEATEPFDILLARDIRTAIQLAAFYERGAIGDDASVLWDEARDSYGLGARLVTKSGLIFRADLANGDEGVEVSIIFGYPWEVF